LILPVSVCLGIENEMLREDEIQRNLPGPPLARTRPLASL